MAKPKKSILLIEEYSSEREIAENQLERLKQISRERLLSYEEVKIFDLLTKNLMLSKGDPTAINAVSTRIEPKEVEVAELVEIASSVSENDIKKVLNFVEDDKDVRPKKPKDN